MYWLKNIALVATLSEMKHDGARDSKITATFTFFAILEYEEIFAMFDTDSDGLISVPDLRIALKNMGMTPTKREIFDMIRQGDIKKKGCIDFPGFMTLLKRKIMVDMDAELAELFSVFDINTDGVICVDDIAKVHAMSGDDIDKRSIDEMIKEADTNNDGVIDFEEFKEVLMKNSINNFLKF
ncbi:putative calmodulin-like protein 6 [Lamellibrachia satsuma]|nr:putative calmodulin-like protein 6 [Lamellibrachia satsuma]